MCVRKTANDPFEHRPQRTDDPLELRLGCPPGAIDGCRQKPGVSLALGMDEQRCRGSKTIAQVARLAAPARLFAAGCGLVPGRRSADLLGSPVAHPLPPTEGAGTLIAPGNRHERLPHQRLDDPDAYRHGTTRPESRSWLLDRLGQALTAFRAALRQRRAEREWRALSHRSSDIPMYLRGRIWDCRRSPKAHSTGICPQAPSPIAPLGERRSELF